MSFQADLSDLLCAFAEIVVAFGGFASIVAIVRSRSSEGESPFELFRAWGMLALRSFS